MLKVFLAEDETLIREGLRDNIPWEQYGYRFVGEAADGEMALPLIRKTKPDVLITDINGRAVIEPNREGRTPKNKDYYHQRV